MEGKWIRMENKKPGGFIDIHTHLLPGIDDGAQDMAQALELLKLAWEDGTTGVVLTPHHRGRYRANTPQMLRSAFDALTAEVNKILPDMKLYLGNEAGIERDLGEKVAEGRVLSLNDSHYMLLEFDYGSSRIQIIDGVMGVISSGYTPIIAHAERYDIFRKNKKLAEEVLGVGALIQLNADSVLGKGSFGEKRCCHRLLKLRQVQFIASDGHDAVERQPLLSEAFRHVSKRYGEEYAWELFRDNAHGLLSGRWH